MKKIMKIVLGLIIAITIALTSTLGYFTATEYYPKEIEEVALLGEGKELSRDELTITTWNVGYAGMGKDMDYFLDGGSRNNPTLAEVEENLAGIIKYLEKNQSDIYMLQEVDEESKRTYDIGMKDKVEEVLGQGRSSYAYNFVNQYVPVPLKDSVGRVKAGLLTHSKYNYTKAYRIPLPGQFSWPTRIFHLKRAMLETRFMLYNDKELIVVNTHNSAFDKGDMRKAQMQFIKDRYIAEYDKGNYVVIGGDWNMLLPNSNLNGPFRAELPQIEDDYMPNTWTWVFEEGIGTVREASKPYNEDTATAIIDGFLLSPNIEMLDVDATDLKFEHTDHNPVKVRIKLKTQ